MPIWRGCTGSCDLCDQPRQIFITGLAKMHWCHQSSGLSALLPPMRQGHTGKSRAWQMAIDLHQESTFPLDQEGSNLVSTHAATYQLPGWKASTHCWDRLPLRL